MKRIEGTTIQRHPIHSNIIIVDWEETDISNINGKEILDAIITLTHSTEETYLLAKINAKSYDADFLIFLINIWYKRAFDHNLIRIAHLNGAYIRGKSAAKVVARKDESGIVFGEFEKGSLEVAIEWLLTGEE